MRYNPFNPLNEWLLRLNERLEEEEGTSIRRLCGMIIAIFTYAVLCGQMGWGTINDPRLLPPMVAFVLLAGLDAELRKRRRKGGQPK